MQNPRNLIELYSGEDLDALFKGGFINFGYWNKELLNKEKLEESDVIQANKQLYYELFKHLDFKNSDSVLEVGSGHGSGCALLLDTYQVSSITGLDYLNRHVDKSKQRNQKAVDLGKIKYIQGKAEAMPFPSDNFTKLFTLEAFQHFNIKGSISEFARVLKKDGLLLISTFFAKKKEFFPEILDLLPRPAILSDNDDETNAALPEVLHILEKNHFGNIKIEAIGNHVWPGYDKWVRQSEPGIWDTNWLIAYQKGLLDYYIIKAKLQK